MQRNLWRIRLVIYPKDERGHDWIVRDRTMMDIHILGDISVEYVVCTLCKIQGFRGDKQITHIACATEESCSEIMIKNILY